MSSNESGRHDALKRIREAMDATGYTWYLFGGALLGAIREGQLISYDRDIDIAVKAEDADLATIREVLRQHKIKAKLKYESPATLVHFQANGLPGHVLFFKQAPGGLRFYDCGKPRGERAYIPDKHFQNPSEVTIQGDKYPGLTGPKDYLTWQYRDWKTPTSGGKSVYRNPWVRNYGEAVWRANK